MDVIMNLGLDAPTHQPDTMCSKARQIMYHALLRHMCEWYTERFEPQECEPHTLVIHAKMRSHVAWEHFDELAALANQDCIAVWSVQGKCGVLRGPHADKWGAFDITKFSGI